MDIPIKVPKIEINLMDFSFEEAERARIIIHQLFEQGLFSLKNGKAILNFDQYGIMQQIEYNYVKWRKGKEELPGTLIPKKIESTIK